jgi:hypothetical protein
VGGGAVAGGVKCGHELMGMRSRERDYEVYVISINIRQSRPRAQFTDSVKRMIWSPNFGDTAFTVPMFDEMDHALNSRRLKGQQGNGPMHRRPGCGARCTALRSRRQSRACRTANRPALKA